MSPVRIDVQRLLLEARRAGEKHTMGFFLALTADLGGHEALREAAALFPGRTIRLRGPAVAGGVAGAELTRPR